MINLKFKKPYLSIEDFPETNLPNFTVITGPNGAGKTHLLQALVQGDVITDVAPEQGSNNQTQIRLFDWYTMIPVDTGYFSSDTIREERLNLLTSYMELRNTGGWLEDSRRLVKQFNFEQKFVRDPTKILEMDLQEIEEISGVEGAKSILFKINTDILNFKTFLMPSLAQDVREYITALATALGKSVASINEEDILSPIIPNWGEIDLFQQSFARLFVAYRDMQLAHNIARYRAHLGFEANFLSEADFVKMHGPAPWDFVNDSLKAAGLDFAINHPNLNDYVGFQPILTKISSGIDVPFSALSSGEKVLMSFAFCIYYANDRRQVSVRPKVLLLDEIDAPLHPSMSKGVINTIIETLVVSFGIRVIATTHSPTTIALAPEESIYTMCPGEPGLKKTTKAEALNILTIGVPTLAISYDGRRQVFVESPADAKVYELIYKLLKPKILSERSLEFVATGSTIPGVGDVHTGCDFVRELVQRLSESGNISVFGLLDWDGKHASSRRIEILAEGRRNGLENVLLDPLLVGLTICHGFVEQRSWIGVDQDDSYFRLLNADQTRLQALADAVALRIFRSDPISKSDSRYGRSLSLSIDSRCLLMDDHQYEEMLLSAFPFLRSITKQRAGSLMEHVINFVLAENPNLIPEDARGAIENLLTMPVH